MILPYGAKMVELPPMTLHVFSLQHDLQGLRVVERASGRLDALETRLLAQPGVRGLVLVSTCNRVELLIDACPSTTHLREVLDVHFDEPLPWSRFGGEQALRHIFEVAAGLRSMVVGEREVAGQLRRALSAAQEAGHASLPLTVAVEEALKTSRRIANCTRLSSAGRSVVAEGLELVGIDDWAATRVLLVGTGSYAGAVVAALRARDVERIRVHSSSGRAEQFAAGHGIEAVAELRPALREAELVVTCRGRGATIQADDVQPGMRLLDLSIVRDVAPEAGAVPGVRLIDLAAIQQHVGGRFVEDHAEAEQLIEAGVAAAMAKLRARIIDPAVAQLRATTEQLVEEEAARLPDRPLTKDEAAYALRRLAARMLHGPSTRARVAAREGRTDAYLEALRELYGIGYGPDAEDVDDGVCPVSGYSLSDLAASSARMREAQ